MGVGAGLDVGASVVVSSASAKPLSNDSDNRSLMAMKVAMVKATFVAVAAGRMELVLVLSAFGMEEWRNGRLWRGWSLIQLHVSFPCSVPAISIFSLPTSMHYVPPSS